jgi:3-hydroxyacyl-[acyl-carrier-protein] dehydratase
MMDIHKILKQLPHRYPFLLVDRVLDTSPNDQMVYYFAGIDGARFKRPVEPGDQLHLNVELLRMKAGIFKFKASAMVGDELACEAELTCAMRAIS